MIYQPSDDSFLIEKYVGKFANGRVLDMGTGSGILAETALKKTDDVMAVDINEEAVNSLKKKVGKQIKIIRSDLFSNVKGKFDLIIFNPPYLPSSKFKDIALDGGRKGYELIERFLENAGNYLENNGIILLLYSTFSKPRKIKQIIKKFGYQEEVLEEKKLFFEKLYVVKLKKKVF